MNKNGRCVRRRRCKLRIGIAIFRFQLKFDNKCVCVVSVQRDNVDGLLETVAASHADTHRRKNERNRRAAADRLFQTVGTLADQRKQSGTRRMVPVNRRRR